jgi:DNA polymerase-3 subunit gamma/tau
MGQALYRKYRPKSLGEVVGQEHIADTLKKAVKSGRISHAYLFTGPRGTGKTSVARILAHDINGLPYDDDSTHLDIIEIDAASNRRIDEIRELRDKVNIAPTSAKYKVYIIDEVHMLTREAFNALLKTLEEPPAHVVFILATTESHKLPETIVSRTQRFTFKPVSPEKVAVHLRTIAKQEGVKITDAALALIARHGEGSFRDSISLLDQASGRAKEVDEAYMQTLLGVPPLEVIDDLTQNLTEHDASHVVLLLAQLRAQGYQPAHIAKQLGARWRDRMLATSTGTADDFALLQKLLDVPSAHAPKAYLEIVLLAYALTSTETAGTTTQTAAPTKTSSAPAVDNEPSTQTASEPQVAAEPLELVSEKPSEQAAELSPKEPMTLTALDENLWPQVLAELKKKHNTLYGVVRMARPRFVDAGTLELGFGFAFHRKRVDEAKNQEIIAQAIKALSGQTIAITCIGGDAKSEPMPAARGIASAGVETNPAAKETSPKPDIASINNIFGGGELLES